MKRHPALIPLSREHHQMLLLAQLLKRDAPPYKGLPQDAEGKVAYAHKVWDELIEPHFATEELHLYPLAKGEDALAELAQKLVAEHETLRRQWAGVKANPGQVEMQDTLGHMLESHIRQEERQLFEKMQEVLPGHTLAMLAEKLTPAQDAS